MRTLPKWLNKGVFVRIGLISLGFLLIGLYLLARPSEKPAQTAPPEPPVRQNLLFKPDSPALPRQSYAHILHKIETGQPVVFLTMDDGQHKESRAIDFIKRRQWPVSLFITDKYAAADYGYFSKLVQNGAAVQNHTLNHHYLTGLSFSEQKAEICAASDKAHEVFRVRPSLLRPPGGHYDSNTFTAAYACGIDAVVMWSAKVDGGMVQFQRGDRLVPGDIVLMHFRPKIMEDLAAFEAEIIRQGLYVARLEDWISIAGTQQP